MGDLVGLKCQPEALSALASGLTRFGPAGGEPEWLVAAVWLMTGDAAYVACASIDVLSDGYLARPLNLDTPEQFTAGLEAELPNVAARFAGRNHGIALPSSVEVPPAPDILKPWPAGAYSMDVLIRVAERAAGVHRVACALRFTSGGSSLLVGTDPSTLAMVISEDDEVIERYRADCETMSAGDYLARFPA